MKRAAKADANQPVIVAALRQAGATVLHLHTVGRGCPDVAVGYQGQNYLMEIKTETGKLTSYEIAWQELWHGNIAIVRSVDDALRTIGAV